MTTDNPSNDDIQSLVTALRHSDGMTRELARDRLVRLGSTATPFLLPLMADHKVQTRWEAAKALSAIADPASIPALLLALEDNDTDVSWLAAEGLIAIGPAVAAPLLQRLIERTGSVPLRQGAHHVLGDLRRSEIGEATAGVHAALSGMHPDVEIVAAAERALRSITSDG